MVWTQLKFPRGKRDDSSRFRLTIEIDAGEKRVILERKGAEMSVFGTALTPTIGAHRGSAAAAFFFNKTDFVTLFYL